jgi:hypothetical protein
MSNFTEAMSGVEDVVDDAFGEAIRVTLMQASEYLERVPRPGFSDFNVTGIADLDGATLGVTGTRYKAKIDANLQGYNAVISVQASQFEGSMRPVPKKGDVFTLIERPTVVKFAVGAIRRDGDQRIHFYGEVISR